MKSSSSGGLAAGVWKKHATTSARKAADLSVAVTSCAPLPQRMPRHCKIRSTTMTETAKGPSVRTSAGIKIAGVLRDDQTDRGRGAAGGKPVAPTDDEVRRIRRARGENNCIGRRCAEWPRRVQPSDDAPKKRVESAENPYSQK